VKVLLRFFGDKMLSAVNGGLCRAYVTARGHRAAARRELEDLSSAINHHRREGLCAQVVEVTLPERPLRRERWLNRQEAARLIWAAWRANASGRPVGKHLARFILVGLYTGTRVGAICGASLNRLSGRGYIDLDTGVFYRRAAGAKETKKRQPPARLPPRLLAHLRRWQRLGLCQAAVVEWNGKPIGRINKAFAQQRVPPGSKASHRIRCGTRLQPGSCKAVATSGPLRVISA